MRWWVKLISVRVYVCVTGTCEHPEGSLVVQFARHVLNCLSWEQRTFKQRGTFRTFCLHITYFCDFHPKSGPYVEVHFTHQVDCLTNVYVGYQSCNWCKKGSVLFTSILCHDWGIHSDGCILVIIKLCYVATFNICDSNIEINFHFLKVATNKTTTLD